MKAVIDLFHEIGMLENIPRSGYAFLGTGEQSVAEHSYRMTLIAYALAALGKDSVDLTKLLMMCLLHDLPEARTGDLNNVNKRYVTADENKVVEELKKQSQLGPQIAEYINEYIENKTLESRLAHDADKLEMLLVLKKQYDLGNSRAAEWIDKVAARVETDLAKTLADNIKNRPSDEWWK